jgi:hypothetical protein
MGFDRDQRQKHDKERACEARATAGREADARSRDRAMLEDRMHRAPPQRLSSDRLRMPRPVPASKVEVIVFTTDLTNFVAIAVLATGVGVWPKEHMELRQ